MNELFRITSTGVNGVLMFWQILPPKFDFVFYEDRVVLFKKEKKVRTVMYNDVKSVNFLKGIGQSVICINAKPIGFNINKMDEETFKKVKQIIGK